jgi:hypothetical protein
MTFYRIQELVSNGTATAPRGKTVWATDYRKIHVHCNVPTNDGEKTKLAN